MLSFTDCLHVVLMVCKDVAAFTWVTVTSSLSAWQKQTADNKLNKYFSTSSLDCLKREGQSNNKTRKMNRLTDSVSSCLIIQPCSSPHVFDRTGVTPETLFSMEELTACNWLCFKVMKMLIIYFILFFSSLFGELIIYSLRCVLLLPFIYCVCVFIYFYSHISIFSVVTSKR